MDSTTIKEDVDTPETPVDGDYYYLKALNYLSLSPSQNVHSDSNGCTCLHCPTPEDKDDDHFTQGFRRGLTRDHDDLHSSGSSCSSPRGSETSSTTSHHSSGASASSSSSSSSPASKNKRERKCSIGGRFYKTGLSAGEFGKIEPKRKMSDGHVHWADEFQKELTRCHPRKSYSRHPSHQSLQVKPILKLSQEESEEC